jgi:ADP-heptose:LPS heptosyltransferase
MLSHILRRLGGLGGRTLRTLRLGAFLMLDSVCKLVPMRERKVAVIVRLDAIGDFFIWMQSGALNTSQYARKLGLRSVLLANSLWADYARRTGLWDEVIDVDPTQLMRNPLYRFLFFLRVRKLGAKLLIQPRAARIFLQEDAIARISGAELRIGSAGTLINTTPTLRSLGNRYFDRLINVDERRSTHEVVRNKSFIEGLAGVPSSRFEFQIAADDPSNPTVVIALGAGQIGRVWPVEKLADLVRYIQSNHPTLSITLLGAKRDENLAALLAACGVSGVVNRVGRTELHEYVEAIAVSKLVICNDSAAYHIAMALNKKVLCFLGGGHYGWFAPYPVSEYRSQKAIVLSVPMECYWCNWNCKFPRYAGGFISLRGVNIAAISYRGP